MSMRTSDVIALTLLASLGACGKPNNADLARAEAEADRAAAADGKILCALASAEAFERVCQTARVSGPDGVTLTITHPDGGFRRFAVLTDGRGLATADGFDETKIAIIAGGEIEVSVGDDRYRLPAAIKGSQAKAD